MTDADVLDINKYLLNNISRDNFKKLFTYNTDEEYLWIYKDDNMRNHNINFTIDNRYTCLINDIDYNDNTFKDIRDYAFGMFKLNDKFKYPFDIPFTSRIINYLKIYLLNYHQYDVFEFLGEYMKFNEIHMTQSYFKKDLTFIKNCFKCEKNYILCEKYNDKHFKINDNMIYPLVINPSTGFKINLLASSLYGEIIKGRVFYFKNENTRNDVINSILKRIKK